MDSDPMPPVLMYHSSAPQPRDPSPLVVSPEASTSRCRGYAGAARAGVSMRELLQARRNGSGHGLVGLTFDDGYADFAQHALPVLQAHGFTATAFVVAGRLGGDNAWVNGQRQPLLTDDQLRKVAANGIEIGSHGLSHVPLTSVTDANLAREID